MSLTTKNQLLIAYKKLVGKSHTNVNFGDVNESVGSSIQIDSGIVFADNIPTTPNTGVYDITNNVVEKIEFDLVNLPASLYTTTGTSAAGITDGGDGAPTIGVYSSGYHAYALKLPSNYESASSNAKKSQGYFVNNQALSSSSGMLQIVPQKYGSLYPAVVSSSSGIINLLDEENYYLDTFSGILFLQDVNRIPTKVTAYLYIGNYVQDKLSSLSSSISNISTSQIISGSAAVKTLANGTRIEASGSFLLSGAQHQITGNLNINGAISASSYLGIPSSTPGGQNAQIQFNDNNNFSGSSNLTFDKSSNVLSGVVAQFTQISSSAISSSNFIGNGSSLINLTSSNIQNFINDVRGQFLAGTGVTINSGQISASNSITDITAGTNLIGGGNTGNVTLSLTSSITGGLNNLTGLTNLYSTTVSGNIVSASQYVGLPNFVTSPGGQNTQIQFNSGSTFSGSSNLVFNYLTNILSATTAQFTNLTASLISASDVYFKNATFNGPSNTEFNTDVYFYNNVYAQNGATFNQSVSINAGDFNVGANIPSYFDGDVEFYKNVIIGNSSADNLTISSSVKFLSSITASLLSGTIARFAEVTASLSGNASTATTLAISRTFTIGNTTRSFNGSENVTWTLTDIGAAQTGSNNAFTGINTFNTNYVTASIGITGGDAKFTTLTASNISSSNFIGNGNNLTNISTSSLVQKTIGIGNTTIGLGENTNTIDAPNLVLTASTAYFSGDVRINGTASIAMLNTVSQSSLVVGDKYIVVMSGGVDHVGLDGAGILWGSGSTAPTVDEQGANAHIIYQNAYDKLEIYPGLYVSGALTASSTISGTNAYFAQVNAKFVGDGNALTNLTASSVSNFTSDVRSRFSNGTGITITDGQIAASNSITNIAAGTNLTGGGNSGNINLSLTSSITGGLDNLTGLTNIQSTNITGSSISSSNFVGNGNNITSITASNISNFTNDVRGQVSAGTGISISNGQISTTNQSTVAGADKQVQFNSGSTFSGSSNLIYNYTTNTLSGTTAQFTALTASNLIIVGSTITSGSVTRRATKISGATTLGSTNHIVFASASVAFTVTLPTITADLVGREYIIKKIDSNSAVITISASSTDLIDGATTYPLNAQYEAVTLICGEFATTSSWYIV